MNASSNGKQPAFINSLRIGEIPIRRVTEQVWKSYERGDRSVFFTELSAMIVRGQHVQFLRDINEYLGGRSFLEQFVAMVREIVQQAEKVDDAMVALCTRTDWNRLSILFDDLLKTNKSEH